jgi:ABC-type sulfate/molybdate transport systems ATPase subunit
MAAIATAVTTATSVVRRPEGAGERRAMGNVDMGCSFTSDRVVTLTGPGGCGKSRLALRVAGLLRAALVTAHG